MLWDSFESRPARGRTFSLCGRESVVHGWGLDGSAFVLEAALRFSTLQSAEKRVAYVYVRPGPNGGALAEANPPNIRDIAFRAD